ncbi:hypothetical protein E2562_001136 [Oryza meyeriana var. granulata]|uniref:Uncharacterized protein n=1 Tax=Oryza meyeriana var. granulata TaxID=110450 RepID=A0A6G1EDT5_9ORYZ|nr:hypothetical protein E2562_001136 [Oryza meyeriana var. granulata]
MDPREVKEEVEIHGGHQDQVVTKHEIDLKPYVGKGEVEEKFVRDFDLNEKAVPYFDMNKYYVTEGHLHSDPDTQIDMLRIMLLEFY